MYYNDFKCWVENSAKDKVFRLNIYSKNPDNDREFRDCDIFVKISDVIPLPDGDFLIWFQNLEQGDAEYYESHKLSEIQLEYCPTDVNEV